MLASMAAAFDPDALRAFCGRDWARARAAKEQFWAEDHRRRGPQAGLAIGAALWEHTRSIDPSWPSPEQRSDDLEHHMELAERIKRVAHVFVDQ